MTGKDSIRARLVRAGCDVANSFRNVEEITAERLHQQLDQVVLIDVRDDAERAVSVLPGAITPQQFEQQQETLAGKTVVAYCTAGYRSGAFAAQLKQRGQPCLNLKDGILGWCQHGFPLQTPTGQSTCDVHVYSRAWNIVDPPYRGVW